MLAKKDTAKTFIVGPILDSDGAAKTDEVVGNVKISKNGGAPGALDGSATLTHRHTGNYSLALTANDIDTLGTAQITLDSTTNAMQKVDLMVVPANVYDSLVGGTDYLDASLVQWLGSAPAALADTDKVQVSVQHDALSLATAANQTTIVNHLTDIKGATWASGTDSLEAIRDRGDAAWITATGFSTLDAAGVRSAVGLSSANLDTQLGDIPTVAEFEARTLVAASYATAANQTTIAAYLDTEVAAILEDTGTTIPALIAALSIPTAAAIADAVWDEGLGFHVTPGSFGYHLGQTVGNHLLDIKGTGFVKDTHSLPQCLTATAVTVSDKTGFTLTAAYDAAKTAAQAGDAMTLTTAYDLYHADIEVTVDGANSQDEYTVTWFKNGARVTSGITSPQIQVVKRADGTDLIGATAMSAIGSTGSLKYDASGAARMTAGEAVLCIVTATIDSASRAFSRVLTRDASS